MLVERSRGERRVFYIVDADASARQAVCRLASAGGFRARALASIAQLVTELEPDDTDWLLLDSSLVHGDSAGRATVRLRSPE
jgi:FixJ family two-component response regulator